MAAGPQPAATSAGPPTKIVARSTKCPREDRTSFPTAEERGACGGDARQRARWTTVERRRLAGASREYEAASTLTWHHSPRGLCRRDAMSFCGKSRDWANHWRAFRRSPNAHSKLQTAPCPCPAAAGWPPRLTKVRRERSAAAMPPSSSQLPEAAPPPGQRTGGLSACERS